MNYKYKDLILKVDSVKCRNMGTGFSLPIQRIEPDRSQWPPLLRREYTIKGRNPTEEVIVVIVLHVVGLLFCDH